MEYKEKYLLLTKQYVKDVGNLHLALKDLRNSHCGLPKSCGHDFNCVCPSDKARELIEFFDDQRNITPLLKLERTRTKND
jgi:hypothetical protein